MGVLVQREPTTQIFDVPAVFLKTEGAILAHEEVDAMVACGIVERCVITSYSIHYTKLYDQK